MSAGEGSQTEQRLLDAAVGLFASQGFTATSVRQVCDRAEANIAAVNYHFGSKMGLYNAAIDHARTRAVDQNRFVQLDSNRDFWSDEPPQTRLRMFVSMLLDHSLDASGRPSDLARIFIHEMLDPTEAFDRQVDVSISRVFDALCDICRLVAADAGQGNMPVASIARIAFLISAQCMYPALTAGVVRVLHPAIEFDVSGREAIADAISSSAVAALTRGSDEAPDC
ncbi:MAG: CerR family C-terminal domain-containing protein [Planctomycetota bacterium]